MVAARDRPSKLHLAWQSIRLSIILCKGEISAAGFYCCMHSYKCTVSFLYLRNVKPADVCLVLPKHVAFYITIIKCCVQTDCFIFTYSKMTFNIWCLRVKKLRHVTGLSVMQCLPVVVTANNHDNRRLSLSLISSVM